MVECQIAEESKAASEESAEASQNFTKESNTTSSPDTDSPVMINVDVSQRMKMLLVSGHIIPKIVLLLTFIDAMLI